MAYLRKAVRRIVKVTLPNTRDTEYYEKKLKREKLIKVLKNL